MAFNDILANFHKTDINYLKEYFKKQTYEWLADFFNAVVSHPEANKDLDSKLKWAGGIICVIPPNTCLFLTCIFLEKLGLSRTQGENIFQLAEKNNPELFARGARLRDGMPECPFEEDLIILQTALQRGCKSYIKELLERIPLYHGIKHGSDVCEIVLISKDIGVIAQFFDVHIAKIGTDKLNEFLREKGPINLWDWDHKMAKQLIAVFRQRGLDPIPSILSVNWLVNLYEICAPEIPLNQLRAIVGEEGGSLLLAFMRINKLDEALKFYNGLGVPTSDFLLSKDECGRTALDYVKGNQTYLSKLLSLKNTEKEVVRLNAQRPETVAKEFLSRDVSELQMLFQDRSYDWLVQFCNAIEAPKDRDTKLQWAERMFTVIPPDICLNIAARFTDKIDMTDNSFTHEATAMLEKHNPTILQRGTKALQNVPECPIDQDLKNLREKIQGTNFEDIHELLERIPHDHLSHLDMRETHVFREVFESKNLKLIAKLLDIHLAKIGLEALQKHLDNNPSLVSYLETEGIKLLNQRGITWKTL